MQFLRFVFWACATVIIAYFLTDIRIGGKTIKENIDSFLQSPQGSQLKDKAKAWVKEKLDGSVGGPGTTEKTQNHVAPAAPSSPDTPKSPPATEEPKEEISRDDQNQLKKLIEKNQ